MQPLHEWTFRAVAADGSGGALFVAGRDDLTEQNIPISYGFRWRDSWSSIDVPFIAISICAGARTDEVAVIAGVYGYVLRWSLAGAHEQRIDATADGPQHQGDLTEIRRIGHMLVVTGMGRTVYVDRSTGLWDRMDYTTRAPEDDEDDPGFTSVHGFSETDLYAVGWEGEIWQYDGRNWVQRVSPTNMVLQKVVCAGDGVVYACGQAGTVIRGRDNSWEVVPAETEESFWGAAWFRERLYLSTLDGLFLLRGDTVEPLDMTVAPDIELPPEFSFYLLDADNDRLWSMGQRKILFTEDGANWREVLRP